MDRNFARRAGTLQARAFVSLIALVASAGVAHADEADEQPIIVTGYGLDDTPATPAYDVQVIDKDQIDLAASGRIEDVLSSAAGFQQFRRSDSRSSNPSAQGVTLRALGGNATSRASVILDGVPLADPFFGYIPFSAIDPAQIAAVRVTRGGGSGAFGSGAVSGVIDMASAGPDQIGLFSGQALVDDRGETQLSGVFAPELGEGFAVVSGQWNRGRGFWTTPEDQRVPASARAKFDQWSIGARAVAPLTDTVELQAKVSGFSDHRTLRFQGADSASTGQDASIRLVGRGNWKFDALAYVQARNFANVVISSTRFVKVLDQSATPSTGLGGKFELRPPVGDAHVLRIGTDYRKSSGELQEQPYSAFSGQMTAMRRAGGANTDLGFFLEDDWTIGPVVLTGGVRTDRWTIRGGHYIERAPNGSITTDNTYADRDGWDTTFRGGAVFNVTKAVRLRAAAYSGIRMPTLNELYRPFVVFPVVTEANADLRNERLVGFEGGVDVMPAEGVMLSATAFDDRVKHAVANVTIATNLRQRRNLDAVHARGLELNAHVSRGTISFDGSLAYTDATVEASGVAAALDGYRPAQTPQIAASGTVAWRPAKGWTLAATLRHIGKQYEDDLQTNVLPAYTTLDTYFAIPIVPSVSLVLRGENITDEKVVTRNQDGSIDLGVPRTLWVGFKIGVR
ncbi:TonB-dependent receptor [Novosphingobium sp. ZN18A2]|uniref:TonB-dependent receptor n=1 Tax=Novosphingobium sp. ZN18A2 TaxID=3079861 RepID=UPI0030D4EA20